MNPLTALSDRILELLEDCYAEAGYPAPAQLFPYHAYPVPDECGCDFASIIQESTYMEATAGGSLLQQIAFGDPSYCYRWVGEFSLVVMRDCWPRPRTQGNLIVSPSAAEMAQATWNLQNDLRVLTCCWQPKMMDRANWGGVYVPDGYEWCPDILFGRVTPIRPRGGCAGLRLRFFMELPACCPDESLPIPPTDVETAPLPINPEPTYRPESKGWPSAPPPASDYQPEHHSGW